VESALGLVLSLFHGINDGLGPFLNGFSKLLHELGVAADLLV